MSTQDYTLPSTYSQFRTAIEQYPRLSSQETHSLFRVIWQVKRMKKLSPGAIKRRQEAIQMIVSSHLYLVDLFASRYYMGITLMSYMDLVHEGVIILLEKIDKIPEGERNPGGYFATALKFGLLEVLGSDELIKTPRRHDSYMIDSLDEPFADDCDLTLGDIVAETVPEPVNEGRVSALYDALHRLPLSQQRSLKDHYKLEWFRPLGAVNHDFSTVSSQRRAALRRLKKDTMLQCSVLV